MTTFVKLLETVSEALIRNPSKCWRHMWLNFQYICKVQTFCNLLKAGKQKEVLLSPNICHTRSTLPGVVLVDGGPKCGTSSKVYITGTSESAINTFFTHCFWSLHLYQQCMGLCFCFPQFVTKHDFYALLLHCIWLDVSNWLCLIGPNRQFCLNIVISMRGGTSHVSQYACIHIPILSCCVNIRPFTKLFLITV